RDISDLEPGLEAVKSPAILKVSRFGYDGKGQYGIDSAGDLNDAWQALQGNESVLEQRVPLDREVSVVLARGVDGQIITYPVAENVHQDGILDVSMVPARIDSSVEEQVVSMATQIASALDYIGVMAVEFFISNGKLLVNEIAPRPHNSGHYTLDATVTSQFEQQVRAVCGLSLGETRLLSPVVMVNLIGDLWQENTPPAWEALLSHANAKLHLYGKREARPGRKMGHYNVLATELEDAIKLAADIKSQL
ncbi:MAG: 5-(carboxyamino)imidazole ribonucleotide synthase, partial [Gammaproteobacteria bacterium]|nr:5-(carboxyamino)imidazole ribonucleotide synthase [Gammaproteobacteria bacterium]